MVLRNALFALMMALTFSTISATPVFAHRDHDAAAEEVVAPVSSSTETESEHRAGEPMAMTMDHDQARRPTTFLGKLIDWLGRTHPMIVHFTLALFPTALLAMLVARKRDDWTGTARFLIIVAGLAAVPAAILGWFAGGFAWGSDGNLIFVHRWLGTTIAIIGGGLALSVWRDWTSASSRLSFAVVGLLTVALAVQGWYGGALVHGADHLAW